MLTPEQEKWIAHLSDTDTVKIVPFDKVAGEKFASVKQKIQETIGNDFSIEHHGATSLGISGQDEIDVYIPVVLEAFDSLVAKLKEIFGEPRSLYPLERVRFVTEENGKHIDIFVINKERDDWKNLLKLETYLKVHPEALEEYEKLKESGNGQSVREYYRSKLIFFNQILSK